MNAYEQTPELSQNEQSIAARIKAGETVWGAYVRGTGRIFQMWPIQLNEDGTLRGFRVTHSGQIQEQKSTLVGEWCPAYDRANEIYRGAPLTDAEKAFEKRRRAIGTTAANIERLRETVALYTRRAEHAEQTEAYALYAENYGLPKSETNPEKRRAHVVKMWANEPDYVPQYREKLIAQNRGYVEQYTKEIAKLEAKLAKL